MADTPSGPLKPFPAAATGRAAADLALARNGAIAPSGGIAVLAPDLARHIRRLPRAAAAQNLGDR